MLRTRIFISSVSSELKSARDLVAKVLLFLGFEPVWQDVFETLAGDLNRELREKIDSCSGVIQLVGDRYGHARHASDSKDAPVSYTQYEAIYARSKGKRVWYILLDPSFPRDQAAPEPEALAKLQQDYRASIRSSGDVYHPVASSELLEVKIHKLNDELVKANQQSKRWMARVTLLLIAILLLVTWQIYAQQTNSILPADLPPDTLRITVTSGDSPADLGHGGVVRPGSRVTIQAEIPPALNAALYLLSGDGKCRQLGTLSKDTPDRKLSFKGKISGMQMTEFAFVCTSPSALPDLVTDPIPADLQKPLPVLPAQTLMHLTSAGVTVTNPGELGLGRNIDAADPSVDDTLNQAERRLDNIRAGLIKQNAKVQGLAFSH
jgi:hypothetical protein